MMDSHQMSALRWWDLECRGFPYPLKESGYVFQSCSLHSGVGGVHYTRTQLNSSTTINIIITDALNPIISIHAFPCIFDPCSSPCRFRQTSHSEQLPVPSTAYTTQKAHYKRTNDIFDIHNNAYANASMGENNDLMFGKRLEDATSLA